MSTIEPITCPLPVIRIGQSWTEREWTVYFAGEGAAYLARRTRRVILDTPGRIEAARARRVATAAFRRSEAALQRAMQLEEFGQSDSERDEAWAKSDRAGDRYHKLHDAAMELTAKHSSRRRRRLGSAVVGSGAIISAVGYALATSPLLYDALAITLSFPAGAQVLGMVGKHEQRKKAQRAQRRSGTKPVEVEPFRPMLNVVTVATEGDPLQLLGDIMSTREGDETGAWTGVIVARLQERFGDRYSDLTVESFRDHLRDNHGITTRKVRMTDVDGESKPLAGFYYETQINAALQRADAA